jgi:urea carboxylase
VGTVTAGLLAPEQVPVGAATFEVVKPGVQTTVQDLPGRSGLWGVGVPPSGAWDDVSFALANRAVGNSDSAAGLEAVLRGPVLRFHHRALVCVTGAATSATLDGEPVDPGRATVVSAGQTLDLGPARGAGLRQYLAVRGGLDVPAVLGSRATFLLGKFGGLDGRALRAGDILPVLSDENAGTPVDVELPVLTNEWELRVVPGPHGAPEHLTDEGVAALFAAEWRIDHRSDRTGVRLVGPAPQWSRADGGDAGLHPSNIHDSAYPVGAIMLSGGTPVIVGPDGPSLGGFVVPAVVLRADRWKLAQARPGDRVRLRPVAGEDVCHTRPRPLLELPASADRPALTVRYAGDHQALVEAGPAKLDLLVRVQIHQLAEKLARPGVRESVEGVRSLLLAVDETELPLADLAEEIRTAWLALPDPATVELPIRDVTLPIALDDESVHEAMRRYQRAVRPDAPWCPDNVEFIRRINDLPSREAVFDLVTEAQYLVVGLGDVYLGAPVAVPLDPRHRLVTTKYDPPRTWTPENAVGIGGVYLCVYGMEGPGGYQLLGRTVPVWRVSADPPWLLRMFDRLRFTPVSSEELYRTRADIAAGRAGLVTQPATLRGSELAVAGETAASAEFTARRQAAFAAERARWAAQ